MRNRIGKHPKIAYDDRFTVTAKPNINVVGMLCHGLKGSKGKPDGNAVPAGKLEHTAYMVLVLVGNNNRGNIVREDFQAGQTLLGFAYAETAVEHDCAAGGSRGSGHQQGIALATASQTGKFQGRFLRALRRSCIQNYFNCSANTDRIRVPVAVVSGAPSLF
jgi:hypothetical protein